MLQDTGVFSLWTYIFFIALTSIALFAGYWMILRTNTDQAKIDKIIDLSKYAIVTVGISTVTLIISNLFKERDQDVKELEYFDKYVEDVKKVNGIEVRFQLAKYLSIVAPSGPMRDSWKAYHDTAKMEYQQYLAAKNTLSMLNSTIVKTDEIKLAMDSLVAEITARENPLATYIKPSVPVSFVKSNVKDVASAKILEERGFELLLKKDIDAAVNAFIQSENSCNQFRQVYEIAQFLRPYREDLKNTNSLTWKEIYTSMAKNYSVGMSKAVKKEFQVMAK